MAKRDDPERLLTKTEVDYLLSQGFCRCKECVGYFTTWTYGRLKEVQKEAFTRVMRAYRRRMRRWQRDRKTSGG
jgi:hypothetical protein